MEVRPLSRSGLLGLSLLVGACGHRPPPGPAAASEPARPPLPYRAVERQRRDYRVGQGCLNGPFQVSVEVPPVRYITRVRVYAVSSRTLPLRFQSSTSSFTTTLWTDQADPRCQARSGEVVAVAPAATAPAPRPTPGAAHRPGAASSAAASAVPATPLLQATGPAPADGPSPRLYGEAYLTAGERREVPDLDGSCWSLGGARSRVDLRLWFPTVQRVDDVVVRVVVEDIEPTRSTQELERAFAERRASDAALAERRAAACARDPQASQCFVGCSRANERSGLVSRRSPGPPPPPPPERRPPRPAGEVEWISGSWRWTGESYAWDPGFWRLPEPPEATVALAADAARAAPPIVAPSAPPPPPVEPAIPPAPVPDVVWVPGYWSWSGTGWLWLAGQWRAPPRPNARFVPPRVVLAPGGHGGILVAPSGWVVLPPPRGRR